LAGFPLAGKKDICLIYFGQAKGLNGLNRPNRPNGLTFFVEVVNGHLLSFLKTHSHFAMLLNMLYSPVRPHRILTSGRQHLGEVIYAKGKRGKN
jgi:hypothetical protein